MVRHGPVLCLEKGLGQAGWIFLLQWWEGASSPVRNRVKLGSGGYKAPSASPQANCKDGFPCQALVLREGAWETVLCYSCCHCSLCDHAQLGLLLGTLLRAGAGAPWPSAQARHGVAAGHCSGGHTTQTQAL